MSQTKDRLKLKRSSSACVGADAALMFIMSWHEQIKLDKIQTLWEGGIWNTNTDLVKIREDAANFMAKFANTSHLDVDVET